MEDKRRSKRALKSLDEGYWDCSVCTYRNNPEAFKCEICDVRKGTSTRKPRLNAQLVAQQVAQQYGPPPLKKEKDKHKKDKSSGSSSHKKHRPPRLKNIDRSSASSMEVTVGNVTVVITDYKPKKERTTSTETSQSVANNNSSFNSSSNDSSLRPDSPDSSTSPSVKTEVNGDTSTEES